MLRKLPVEAIVWATGLIVLACMDTGRTHLVICPLALLDIPICPGCGLGESISLLFHGRLEESVRAHPLGVFAVFVLSLRMTNLTKQFIQHYGKNN